MTKLRGFELISQETNTQLIPKRATKNSAGYDFVSSKEITIQPGEIKLIPTGVKAYMKSNELLYLFDRSSNAKKLGLVLINSVGVIDSDYYNNKDNEGHIFAQMKNISDKVVTIKPLDRIAQGVFMTFLIADKDEANGERTGGFGSTNK